MIIINKECKSHIFRHLESLILSLYIYNISLIILNVLET